MSIILYENDETEFTSNGIGSLSDALSCSVHEERNGEFELSMTYPIVGRRYSDLRLRRIIAAKPDPYRDLQPFRIYEISKPFNGIVNISARHISYDLIGYPTSGIKIDNAINTFLERTIRALNVEMTKAYNLPREFEVISNIGSSTKFKVGKYYTQKGVIYRCIRDWPYDILEHYEDISYYRGSYLEVVDNAKSIKPHFIFSYVGQFPYNNMVVPGNTVVFPGPTNMKSILLGNTDNSLISVMNNLAGSTSSTRYGAFELEWDKWNVILHEYRGGDKDFTIRYKKNMLDFQQEETSSEVYTGIYPYTSSDEVITTLDGNGIVYCDEADPSAVEIIPDQILVADLTSEMPNESLTDKALLREQAKQYIIKNNLGKYTISITVSFVDLGKMVNYENLESLEKVMLCDLVHIYFLLGDIATTAEVTALTYNVLTDKYDDITLGVPRSNVVSSIAGQKSSKNTITEIPSVDLLAGYGQLNEKGEMRVPFPRTLDLRYDSEGQYLVTSFTVGVVVEEKTDDYFTFKGPANTFFTWEIFAAHEYHAGTLSDPIPYTGHMTLRNGRYYSETSGTPIPKTYIYRCILDSIGPYGSLDHSSTLSNCALVTLVSQET